MNSFWIYCDRTHVAHLWAKCCLKIKVWDIETFSKALSWRAFHKSAQSSSFVIAPKYDWFVNKHEVIGDRKKSHVKVEKNERGQKVWGREMIQAPQQIESLPNLSWHTSPFTLSISSDISLCVKCKHWPVNVDWEHSWPIFEGMK